MQKSITGLFDLEGCGNLNTRADRPSHGAFFLVKTMGAFGGLSLPRPDCETIAYVYPFQHKYARLDLDLPSGL